MKDTTLTCLDNAFKCTQERNVQMATMLLVKAALYMRCPEPAGTSTLLAGMSIGSRTFQTPDGLESTLNFIAKASGEYAGLLYANALERDELCLKENDR